MNKKKLIKTLVTVLPVFLVPLIVERKKIKKHPDVQKVTDATQKATKAVVDTSTDVKEYIVDKKDAFEEKREIKKIERENDPAYIQAQIEKQKKEEQKEAKKMRNKLEKHIEARHKEEEKLRKSLQKARIKSMKEAQKRVAKAHDASKADAVDTTSVQELAERLNTRIEERHAAESLLREQNLESRVKTFEAYVQPKTDKASTTESKS